MLPLSNFPSTDPLHCSLAINSHLLMLYSFRVEPSLSATLQKSLCSGPYTDHNAPCLIKPALPSLTLLSLFSCTILPHLKTVQRVPLERRAQGGVTDISCFPMPTGSSPGPSGRRTTPGSHMLTFPFPFLLLTSPAFQSHSPPKMPCLLLVSSA